MYVISVQDAPSCLKSAPSTRKSQGASSRQPRHQRRSIVSTPAHRKLTSPRVVKKRSAIENLWAPAAERRRRGRSTSAHSGRAQARSVGAQTRGKDAEGPDWRPVLDCMPSTADQEFRSFESALSMRVRQTGPDLNRSSQHRLSATRCLRRASSAARREPRCVETCEPGASWCGCPT
jgi:hypothetical protein